MNELKIGDVYRFVEPSENFSGKIDDNDYAYFAKTVSDKWVFMGCYVDDGLIEIIGITNYTISYNVHRFGKTVLDNAQVSVLLHFIDIGVFVLLSPAEKIGHEYGLI